VEQLQNKTLQMHSLRLPRCTSSSIIFKTYFLLNDPQELPLTSVACLHCRLLQAMISYSCFFLIFDNHVTSLAGAFDRRYTGDTHDPIGLREKIEGVTIGHQVDGEVSRRS